MHCGDFKLWTMYLILRWMICKLQFKPHIFSHGGSKKASIKWAEATFCCVVRRSSTLYTLRSTFEFSFLAPIHFLQKLWGEVDKISSRFILCDHVRNSHENSVLQSIDITRRNLMLITLRAWRVKQRRRWGRQQQQRQKAMGQDLEKQQLRTCITHFCTFLWRHCTTTTWNFLISVV